MASVEDQNLWLKSSYLNFEIPILPQYSYKSIFIYIIKPEDFSFALNSLTFIKELLFREKSVLNAKNQLNAKNLKLKPIKC